VKPDWKRLKGEPVKNIQLSDSETKRVVKLLRDEVSRAVSGLAKKNEETKEYRDLYLERRKPKTKPYVGCSNIAMPIIAPDVDLVTSRTVRTLQASRPPAQVIPAVDQDVELEELTEAQKLMNSILEHPALGLEEFESEFVHEVDKVGIGIAKVKWDTQTRNVCRYKIQPSDKETDVEDNIGIPEIVEESEVVYEGNTIETIKIEDFIYPPEEEGNPKQIQSGYWVAHRYAETMGEIQRKCKEGVYDKKVLEQLKDVDERRSRNDFSSYIDEESAASFDGGVTPDNEYGNRITLYEIHIRFNFKDEKRGAQKQKDCIFVCHFEPDLILSARYNFFFHGKRPFVRAPFHEIGTFRGKGIAQRLKYMQHASNDVVNMGIDAGTWANLLTLIKKPDAGIQRGKQDNPMPGSIIVSEDPASVQRLDLGDASGSVFQFLPLFKEFAEKAGGVTGTLAGMEGERGNRETASGAGQRTGNSSPLFDILLDCVRRALEEAFDMMFWNQLQFKPEGTDYVSMDETGVPAKKRIELPVDAMGKYRTKVVTSSVAANPELRKQTVQHFMGLLDPAEQQLVEVMGQISNPDTPDMVRDQLVQSLSRRFKQLKQIAEAFELPGAPALVPDFEQQWAQKKDQVMQEIQQAKQQKAQQKPPLEAEIARKVAFDWEMAPPEIQAQIYERMGFEIPTLLAAQVKQIKEQAAQANAQNQPAPNPMGGPEGGGPAGPMQPPPGQ
jgi:hypothetical protein